MAEQKALPMRTKVLIALLVAVILLGGASAVQTHLLRGELKALAQVHQAEFEDPGKNVTSLVTVSRDMLVFGTPRAKIEVFQMDQGSAQVTGIEYHYVKEDGEWRNTESGICHGTACQTRGVEAFQDMGVDVPRSILEKTHGHDHAPGDGHDH